MSKISILYILFPPPPNKTFICSFSSILLEGRGKGLILADGHNFGATSLLLPFLTKYQEGMVKFQNREECIAKYLDYYTSKFMEIIQIDRHTYMIRRAGVTFYSKTKTMEP